MDPILCRILQLIEEKKLKEKDLLIATSINTSFLTDWKKGRLKNPSCDKLIKISQYLNVSLDYLLTGSDFSAPTLSKTENTILNMYRSLNEKNQIKIEGMLELLCSDPNNKKPQDYLSESDNKVV